MLKIVLISFVLTLASIGLVSLGGPISDAGAFLIRPWQQPKPVEPDIPSEIIRLKHMDFIIRQCAAIAKTVCTTSAGSKQSICVDQPASYEDFSNCIADNP